jgi:hypothetical protein
MYMVTSHETSTNGVLRGSPKICSDRFTFLICCSEYIQLIVEEFGNINS